MQEFDYIIVGAGSAGCVIATLLIENTDATVLLIEAGPEDNSIYARMPAGMPYMIANRTWKYETEPEPHAGGRKLDVPQGKVLGGSSSVNGMAYVRGEAMDYDEWQDKYGCSGWSYQDVLAFFIEAENNESMSGKYHGTKGHLPVAENRFRHVLANTFLRAGQELGFPYLTDFNAENRQGVGFYNATLHNGQRASVAYAYLAKVKSNKRLCLVTNALTEKVLFKNNQAIGVSYKVAGKGQQALAKREVIICAGAIGSPKILMLSGIGDAKHLAANNIELLFDNPNVGKHYQDHLHVNISATLQQPISLAKYEKGLPKIWAGLEWLLFKDGPVTSNILESGGFFDLDHDGRNETQIHTFPLIENFGNKSSVAQQQVEGFTLKLGHLYPSSRGQVFLRSNLAEDLPLIRGNYLAEQTDVDAMVRAVRFGLSFFSTPSMQEIIVKRYFPSDDEISSTQNLEEFIRHNSKTVFHPVGTCRMGGNAASSVLDNNLKVWGVENLRVIDSSVFPHIVSGNTNAPVIMVAHKGAKLIITKYLQRKSK